LTLLRKLKNPMTELVLEPGQYALPDVIQPVDAPAQDATDEEKATMLPEPTGWKLLCAVPPVSEKIDGTELDLVRDTSTMRQEESATTVLFVMKVGPDAYKDQTKFPAGAWCKEGDFVLFVPILVRGSRSLEKSSGSSMMTKLTLLCKTHAV